MSLLIPFFEVIDIALQLYTWAVIISVILSWLVAFNVVNPSNQIVRMIGMGLHQIVEPALNRIRRVLPMFGALDLSPVVLLLLIYLVRRLLVQIEVMIVG